MMTAPSFFTNKKHFDAVTQLEFRVIIVPSHFDYMSACGAGDGGW